MKLARLSLSSQILIGTALGIAAGLFFGEMVSPLQVVGTVFIKLLQITLIPYVAMALIYGTGRLTMGQAKGLGKTGGSALILFWVLTLAVIFAVPLIFPHVQTASFFSAEDRPTGAAVNYFDLFIPTNPFRSLAEGMIPAVVLFSLATGLAVINIPAKQPLLDSLSVLLKALQSVSGMVFRITPIGVFALSAVAVGTMGVEQMNRLQAYMLGYITAAMLLTFVILPAAVCILTPFKYREILSAIRDLLILGFLTLNVFVILPLIAERVHQLYAKVRARSESESGGKAVEDDGLLAEVVLPVAYSFPITGSLFPILFVLFTAWFYDQPMGVAGHLKLAVSGVLNLFAGAQVAVPMLLNQMRLPSDAMKLYLISDALLYRFSALTSVMGLGALSLIVVSLRAGLPRRGAGKMAAAALVAVGCMAGVLAAERSALAVTVSKANRGAEIISGMRLREAYPAKVHRSRDFPLEAEARPKSIAEIRSRGVLRVGYIPDAMPLSYFNKYGELVGYDIAMAHNLAYGFECAPEFFPVTLETMPEDLDTGRVDVVMSGVSISPELFDRVAFSDSYLTLQIAFVVRDYRHDEFVNGEDVQKMPGLKIAVSSRFAHLGLAQAFFPKAQFVLLNSARDFFIKGSADALLTTAEEGATWTLLYPEYDVVVTEPSVYKDLLSYPVAKGAVQFHAYLNHWLRLASAWGLDKEEYDYWILGKNPTAKEPHWSIIRNVLHWVE